MKVSELLVRSLEAYGAQRVYGLAGTSILELMDALSRSGLKYVSTRHEQVAVSMADAEGRLTGRPGVAFVHGGPGFLNSLISLTNAWKDGSPMLLVAGAVKRRMTGMDSWQDAPQREMVRDVVKRAWRVERGSEAARAFSEAYSLAVTPPTGPVFIEIPEDVMSQEAGSAVFSLSVASRRRASDDEIKRVAAALGGAQRPLIVVGGGMNCAEGEAALLSLLSRVEAPVVTTGNGRGTLREDHPLALGRIGFGGGSSVADGALLQADVVLCLGCGLSDMSTYGFNLTPKGDVYVVDMDPIWDRKPVPYTMHIDGDAPDFALRLGGLVDKRGVSIELKAFIDRQKESWDALLSRALSQGNPRFVNAACFFQALDRVLPTDAIIAAGEGLHLLYSYAFVKIRSSRSFMAATNMGSMGFVFPAALGAKMVHPEKEVVAIMGDGEFLMTMQDMETAVREKVGAKIVVLNDNSYRVLLMRQKIQKMGRIFGTTHSNPDLVKIAEAFGAQGMSVGSDGEIDDAVRFLMEKSDSPKLVELKVDPEDLPPLNIQGSLMF